ncbi:MAG: hypothetical protein JW751_15075 [Polyangiaceae bacterium]|nr:hypothetical protein [Polyangiaceae bacterium]
MRSPHLAWTALLALLAVACPDDTEQAEVERATLVAIDPDLLPGVACTDAPGALRTYVATIADTTPFREAQGVSSQVCDVQTSVIVVDDNDRGAGGAEGGSSLVVGATVCPWVGLPSSGPVPCELPVSFGFVVPGHRYLARVDGYDRHDLIPFAEGHPDLVDPDTGEYVAPRWVWLCEDPAIAVYMWTSHPRGCRLLTPGGGSDETTIRVPVASLLGEASCGEGADEIERLEFVLETTPPASQTVDCSGTAVFSARDGIELRDGQTYRVAVSAYLSGAAVPTLATSCYAKSLRGVASSAVCDPLQPVDG